jgi:hypothetical protein
VARRSAEGTGCGCFIVAVILMVIGFLSKMAEISALHLVGGIVAVIAAGFLLVKVTGSVKLPQVPVCPTCGREPGSYRVCRNCGRVVPGR